MLKFRRVNKFTDRYTLLENTDTKIDADKTKTTDIMK